MTKLLIAAMLVAGLWIPTASYAASSVDTVFKVASIVADTAKVAIVVAKVVVPAPLKPVVQLINLNMQIYANVGCQLGKVIYGQGC